MGKRVRRLLHYLFLALVVLLSAFGFLQPVAPPRETRPNHEQAEPARKR